MRCVFTLVTNLGLAELALTTHAFFACVNGVSQLGFNLWNSLFRCHCFLYLFYIFLFLTYCFWHLRGSLMLTLSSFIIRNVFFAILIQSVFVVLDQWFSSRGTWYPCLRLLNHRKGVPREKSKIKDKLLPKLSHKLVSQYSPACSTPNWPKLPKASLKKNI